ncbi:MAG: T9SS type A sorting domain-containing protein [Flavisolibacter sp.]
MRKVLLAAFLPLSFSMIMPAQAQDRFAFAITDLTQDGINWTALRKLDLRTGTYGDVLINGTDMKFVAFDANSKKELSLPVDSKWGNLIRLPFSNGVAAAAYDRTNNRIYYTPMFVDQLRYIDLRTMRVYYVNDQAVTGAGNMHNNEGKAVTRMVIAPDGYGYAITNDGSSLVRFTTGKKVSIENLGALVDDPANPNISIHNRCSSFGGDMICDDDGNLFIISAFNNVFKVNVNTRVATHVAHIENLPAGFTSNGAVVDDQGKVLVSSATNGSSYYVVDPKTWSATPAAVAGVYKASDLANGNYLSTRAKMGDVPLMTRVEEKFSNLISVYPNPVTANNITVQFNKVPKGDYTVELTDVIGRSVMQRKLTVASENQTQVLPLNESNAKGVYMVKVYDVEKQSVFTQKVVVQ